MKLLVDRSVCEIHAQCVFAAPDVFSLGEDDGLVYDPEPGDCHLAAVQQAAAVTAGLVNALPRYRRQLLKEYS